MTSSNIDDVLRDVDRAFSKQIPFALSKGLNDTATEAINAMKAQLPKKLDRPTPFTMRAFALKRSTKRNLVATVYVKPIQAEYLEYQILGGTRRPKGKALLVPRGVRLNKYGNIPRKRVQTLLARPDTFSGTINGVAGIWQRGHHTKTGRWSTAGKAKPTSLRLLVAYEPKASYRPLFPMQKIVNGVFNRTLSKNVSKAIDYAIETAK